MVQVGGRIGHGGSDVIPLQVRIVAEDLFFRGARGEHIQDVLDPYPHAPDAGAPPAFSRLDGDALQKVIFHG